MKGKACREGLRMGACLLTIGFTVGQGEASAGQWVDGDQKQIVLSKSPSQGFTRRLVRGQHSDYATLTYHTPAHDGAFVSVEAESRDHVFPASSPVRVAGQVSATWTVKKVWRGCPGERAPKTRFTALIVAYGAASASGCNGPALCGRASSLSEAESQASCFLTGRPAAAATEGAHVQGAASGRSGVYARCRAWLVNVQPSACVAAGAAQIVLSATCRIRASATAGSCAGIGPSTSVARARAEATVRMLTFTNVTH